MNPKSDKHHEKSKSAGHFEERVKKGSRVVTRTNRLVTKVIILVLSLVTLGSMTKPLIIEYAPWLGPTECQLASHTWPAITNVKLSSDSTSHPRKPRGQRPSSAVTASLRTSPAIESFRRRIAPFTLPRGIPVGFREERGVVRSQELPTVATLPRSWGQ